MLLRAGSPREAEAAWGAAVGLHSRVAGRLFPWLQGEADYDPVTAASAIRGLSDLWVDYFGAPDDPDVAAKIAATVAALERRVEGR